MSSRKKGGMPHDHGHQLAGTGASGPGRMAPEDAMRVNGAATAASVGVALILCVAKAGAFGVSGSVAVLASLADSALDLAASLMTFFAVRYAASPADAEHRHGHGKAEALAALLQAVLVAFSAALIVREAVVRLTAPEAVTANGWAIAVMVLSIVLTVALVQVQTRALRKTGSVAVSGDRAHYMADLAANGAVIAALGVLMLGGPAWVDPLIGAGIAAWLVWGAWSVARAALDQMMDRELDEKDRDRILEIARGVPGVISVHDLRTRAAGPLVHLQMHVDLAPDQSLTDAHVIVVEVERAIHAAFPGADVLIHPDPAGRAEAHGHAHFGDDDAHAPVRPSS